MSPENVPNSSGEKNENITYERRSFEQYLIDYQIPTKLADIGQTTVTGNGTLTKPYQINSTQDFVYFANLGMNDKYFELNCDIVYNEETFDENGNPSGGDGVYYEWRKTVYCARMNLDGKSHYLRGFFYEDLDSVNTYSIFNSGKVNELKNIKLKNIYFNLFESVSALGSAVEYTTNVVFEKGYIYSRRTSAGIVYNSYKQLSSCENYASVVALEHFAAGGVCYRNIGGVIKNCKNFGEVQGISTSGGICVDLQKGKIYDCENYARITVELYHGAGIIGQVYYGGTIENCVNYGDVYTTTNQAIGGICGTVNGGFVEILNCDNYGRRCKANGDINPNFGQMIGYITMQENKSTTVITVKGCGSYSSYTGPIVGGTHQGSGNTGLLVVNIEYCFVKVFQDNSYNNYLFMFLRNNSVEVNARNNVVELESSRPDFKFSLFRYKVDDCPVKLNIENLVVNAKIKTVLTPSEKENLIVLISTYHNSTYINVKNAIFNFDVDGEKTGIYYGDDFDDYCVSWKTGKMSVRAISGKDWFQQKVTEEMLIEKGYEKRVD